MGDKVVQMYDKLTFNDFECRYANNEDVGFAKPFKDYNFDECKFNYDTEIPIFSDTHNYPKLGQVLDKLSLFRYWIHAGDIGSPELLDVIMGKFTGEKVFSVLGNHDRPHAAGFLYYKSKYKDRLIMEYDSLKFRAGYTDFFMWHENENINLDSYGNGFNVAIVYGHTHRPVHYVKNNLHVINPGMLNDSGGNVPTFCVFNTEDGTARFFKV